MPISLDQLLSEADELIEKNASQRPSIEDEDIFKLAEKIQEEDQPLVETPFEKIAHAVAIIETVQAINKIKELESFEKTAKENGYSEQEIDKYLSDKDLLPLHKTLVIPGELLC